MSGITNKTDNEESGMDLLQEPLLEVQPVLVPVVPMAPPPVAMAVDVENPPGARPLEASNISGVCGESTTTTVDVVSIDIDAEIDEHDWVHGEAQPEAFRDCFWAILFLLQLAAVMTLAGMGIRNAIKEGTKLFPSNDDHDDDDDNDDDRYIIWYIVTLLSTVVLVPSILINLLLGAFASMLIQISLVFTPISFLIAFVGSFVTMNCPIALFSLIFFVVGVYYAVTVWHKVPFATANLKIALAAIKDNHGLWIIAYAVTAKAYVWILLWGSAVSEMAVFSPGWIQDCPSTADDDDGVCTISTRGKLICLGMLLSLFWTSQVIKNTFHTTIAGVVGTWWFDPQEATSRNTGLCGCCGCTPAIFDSYIRSSFHSLGSIAFGSLLVGILQVLQIIVRCGRQQRDQQRRVRGIQGTDFLFCLLQYFVDQLERLMEYINVWAFVYVGLYGYDYWTAGKKVSTLFRARGWDVIINDNLVARSLSMMSILISMITGLIGLLLGLFLLGLAGAIQAFVTGFVLGWLSCQVLFGVVISAVNTVVVCFAESPNQLRENGHDPEHFRDLIEAYRKAYPNNCGF